MRDFIEIKKKMQISCSLYIHTYPWTRQFSFNKPSANIKANIRTQLVLNFVVLTPTKIKRTKLRLQV